MSWPSRLVTASLVSGSLLLVPHPASADPDCDAEGGAGQSWVGVGMTCSTDPSAESGQPASGQPASDSGEPEYSEFQWLIVCATPNQTQGGEAHDFDCRAAQTCPDPRERSFRLWGLSIDTGGWVPLSSGCFGAAPDAPEPARPQVTEAMVLNEIRRIGLPVLEARTQPEDKTLVNFDTIFYTQAQPFSTTVTLLGQRVGIVAEPTEFTWHHGDGTTSTTGTPGAPYPSKDVTYRYGDADVTVHARVDVTYTARFRVGGGAWQDISETVTITGTETPLRVAEAAGTLSGNYD